MVVRAIERGMKLTVVQPSSRPLENLNENIHFCASTPLQVQYSWDKIHFIENLIIGGAAVSEHIKRQFRELGLTDHKVFETYGMSETLSHIALKQIAPHPEEYFTVLDDVEISLDDRNCLKIFAPQLNAGRLQTNDIVELKNDKQFRFIGRYDHVINSGGVKIFAEELEDWLKAYLSPLDFANELVFLGKPDEILGEKLVLVIEGTNHDNLNSKISNLKFSSKFHLPKEVVFLDQFPRSANGKVLRKEILKLI